MKKLDIDTDPLLKLIAAVGKPIDRDVAPVDLLPHIDSLRELIEHAKGAYQAEVDELKDRHDRAYAKKYDDNFTGPQLPIDPAYDYRAEYDEKERINQWAELYEQMYKPPEGNPATRENKYNPGGPRPGYLRPVYKLVKWWWEDKAKLGKFQPDFAGIFKDDMHPYDFDWCNSAARLLHLIVLECDPGYRIENSANLPRAFRK
jgi:hypothetical protein